VSEASFEYLQHLVTVPVKVGGIETPFVLDSGIGLTLVREELADATRLERTGGSFTGRRMSGQAVTLPLAEASVTFAGSTIGRHAVGILDMGSFPDMLAEIGGFLSLAFFTEQPVTVDYARRLVVLDSAEGVSVPVKVERDGPSVTVFMPLTIPGGGSISVEVDMGSDELILDERFAPETGAALAGDGVRRVEGTDETGHRYTRTFTRLSGSIHPTAAPGLRQDDPPVMFQKIIHDGLLGDAFLRRHAVTFDVAEERMMFG
jgi:Aspartyl protease